MTDKPKKKTGRPPGMKNLEPEEREQRDKKIKEMAAQGVSVRDTAIVAGCGKTTVKNVLEAYGIKKADVTDFQENKQDVIDGILDLGLKKMTTALPGVAVNNAKDFQMISKGLGEINKMGLKEASKGTVMEALLDIAKGCYGLKPKEVNITPPVDNPPEPDENKA